MLRSRANVVVRPKDTETSSQDPVQLQAQKEDHVNFFSDLEKGKIVSTKSNAAHEKEKKDEQEKYEKQIGYLTYLGQDTNEALKKRDWYEEIPNRKVQLDESGNKVEIGLKMKMFNDPLFVMERYLGKSLKSKPKETVSNSAEEISTESTSNTFKKYESILGPSIKLTKKRKASPDPGEKSSRKLKKSKKSKNKKDKKHKKSKSERKHKGHLSDSESSNPDCEVEKRRSRARTKRSHHKSKSVSKEKTPSKSKLQDTPESSPLSSDSSEDEVKVRFEKEKLAKLRAERIEREKAEKLKADLLLGLVRDDVIPKEKKDERPVPVRQKYNSQFNPELARQNAD